MCSFSMSSCRRGPLESRLRLDCGDVFQRWDRQSWIRVITDEFNFVQSTHEFCSPIPTVREIGTGETPVEQHGLHPRRGSLVPFCCTKLITNATPINTYASYEDVSPGNARIFMHAEDPPRRPLSVRKNAKTLLHAGFADVPRGVSRAEANKLFRTLMLSFLNSGYKDILNKRRSTCVRYP